MLERDYIISVGEKGGSNTPVFRFKDPVGRQLLVKQYGHEPYDQGTVAGCFNPVVNLPIIHSILDLQKRLLASGIRVPNIHQWSNVPENLTYQEAANRIANPVSEEGTPVFDSMPNTRIVTVEDDVGVLSVRKIIEGQAYLGDSKDLVHQMLEIIERCPYDCAIDTNPANFTLDISGYMYYVDFAPPKVNIRGYERELYSEIFPNAFRSSVAMGQARSFLYHNPQGRKLRLWYHLFKSSVPNQIKRIAKRQINSVVDSL